MLHKVLPTDEVSALVEASPTSPTGGGGGKRPPWEVDLDEDPSQEALDRLAMAPSELPLPLLAPTVPRAGQTGPAASTISPSGGAGGDERCCVAAGCTLVSQRTGWCSGATTEDVCHRSRTEGRPCVWVGSRCTKGYLFGQGDEPSCPPPEGRLSPVAAGMAADGGEDGSLQQQRVSHFDPRLAANDDFVDVRAVLARLDARVVYIGEDDGMEESTAAAKASIGGTASNTRPVASTLMPRVRIGRRRCQRDFASCKRDVARAMGVQLGGPRASLPNDAL